MVRFLWIEDFEQDKNIVVEQVFGAYLKTLGIPKPPYPEEWPRVLEGAGIWLKENFLDGYRFLENPETLRAVDFVVLDIDLRPNDPEDDDPATQAAVADIHRRYFDDSRERMKERAGYLLFKRMVLDLRFPRERTLICSNHGQYIETKLRAFKEALWDTPEVFPKRDPRWPAGLPNMPAIPTWHSAGQYGTPAAIC